MKGKYTKWERIWGVSMIILVALAIFSLVILAHQCAGELYNLFGKS
jgi:hypothetical protein